MIIRRSSLLFGLIFLSVFIFSLMLVTPVRADDGVTTSESVTVDSPPPASGDVASPPAIESSNPAPVEGAGDIPSVSQEITVSSSDPTEPEVEPANNESPATPVVVPETGNTEPKTETGTPTTANPVEVTPQSGLVAALNESNLVLVDNQGEAIPMASNDVQVVSEAMDPYFKSGVDYIGYSTSGTCAAIVTICNTFVPAGTLITSAINAYGTTYALTATGSIFLEAGTYNENVIINSAPNLAGLIGAGSNSNPLFGTVINGSISVQNTIKGFTLQGLNVGGNVPNGLITFNNNTGALIIQDVVVKNTNASGDGIVVTNQTGIVTFNKVESSNNGDEGASITSTGNVAVTNSAFDRNSGPVSLSVTTPKSITLNGVSSSLNSSGSGASLSAGTGITINNSHFQNNYDGVIGNIYGFGIYIVPGTKGAIILNSVFANSNQESNIYMSGVNSSVNMTDVDAGSSSHGYGVYIDNCIFSGPTCTSSMPGTTTLTNLDIQNNYNSNLYVFSSGAITVSNINAAFSSGINGYLENRYSVTPQNIAVSNGYFRNGTAGGLSIYTKGSVTLNHIESNYGGFDGIFVDATSGTGTVTILSTLGRNTASGNTHIGLAVNAKGSISVDGIDAGSNLFAGIFLANTSGTGSVTLKNTNADSNSTAISDWSVYIQSKGAVTVSNLGINNSNGYGAWIENDMASSAMPVTVTTGSINSNDNDGMIIISKGIVKVDNVYLSSNNALTSTYGGLYINNSAGTGTVTVKNSSLESNYKGLTILSHGAITLDAVSSGSSDYDGATLDNTTAAGTANGVTIKNSNFNNNGIWGLKVLTKGPISITSIIGNGNNTLSSGGFSVLLDNTLGAASGVTMAGTQDYLNNFAYNTLGGLSILTNGTVTINHIYVYLNGVRGIDINDTGAGAVTISDLISNSNKNEGLNIIAKGTITLNNPNVSYNESAVAGISLDNSSGTGSVIVKGPNVINLGYIGNNHNLANTLGKELIIFSNGSITLSYLSLTNSPESGLEIHNIGGAGAVSLTSVNSSYNGGTGISIDTAGTVTLIGVDANSNGSSGVNINNTWGTAKSVTVTNSTTNSNGYTGLHIITSGIVTLSGITSNSNIGSGNGLEVDNSYGPGGITLSNSAAAGNVFVSNTSGYGVYFISNGAVAISKTTVNNNGLTGILVTNTTGAVSPITLMTVQSNNNSAQGIRLVSDGNITGTGVTASGNNLEGLSILNTFGTGIVTITNGIFESNSGGDGLSVYSNGAITLTNVEGGFNAANFGAELDNSSSVALLSPGITIKNSGTLMNSFSGNLSGLKIITKGAVNLVNILSEGNTSNSIYINNATGTAGVTLTNIQTTSNNGIGLLVRSRGAVTGTNISGDGAASSTGIVIDNCQVSGVCTGSGAVTLTKVTVSYSGTGLDVKSNGNITVSQLTGKQNYAGYGVILDNSLSSINATVSVSKANLYNNSLDGLRILSKGIVTLNGISSTDNYSGGANGVYVDNTFGSASVNVLNSLGLNTFNTNTGSGLRILSLGNIAVTGVTANTNALKGLNLSTTGAGKTVTLTTINVKNNSEAGIVSQSTGAAVFTGLKVYDNGLNTNNDGINVITNGYDFTLSNSTVTGNGNNGIDATVGGIGQKVKILNTLYFGNGQYGGTDVQDIITDGTLLFA